MQALRFIAQRKYFLFSVFLMMIVLMVGTICSLMVASAWLNSYKGIVHTPDSHYDYIVVGAGTAGCVLASHLVNDIRKPTVLLVEAGEYFPWWSSVPLAAPLLQETAYDWTYRTVPQLYSSWGLHNETSKWPRGRGLGGSGQINYMVHFPGIEKDFEKWKEMGVGGWNYKQIQSTIRNLLSTPIEKIDFLNTYSCANNYNSLLMEIVNDTCPKKLMNMFQTNKFHDPKLHVTTHTPEISVLSKAFLKAGEELKQQEYNTSFFTPAYSTIKDGHRWSTFDGFLKPVLAKHNLHVLLKTTVSKVLFSETKKAFGIEIMKPMNQSQYVYSNKEIILCAGTINTPQILLLSGVGPQQHLQHFGIPVVKDLPVGFGLHDHLNIPLYVSIKRPVSVTVNKILHVSQFLQYLLYSKGYLASSGIVGVGSVSSSSIGIVLFGLGSVDENLLRRVANYKISTFRSLFPFSENMSQEGFVLLATCLQPLSRGFISLQSSDPLQPPSIDPQYLSQRHDISCMINAIKFAARLVNTQPLQDLGAKLHLPQLDECKQTTPHIEDEDYLECLLRTAAITGYHPGGTCKMGNAEDLTSVVDSFLRVHGTSGLRVVDASIMPTPVSGHPNSIITSFSQRAASFILNSPIDVES